MNQSQLKLGGCRDSLRLSIFGLLDGWTDPRCVSQCVEGRDDSAMDIDGSVQSDCSGLN